MIVFVFSVLYVISLLTNKITNITIYFSFGGLATTNDGGLAKHMSRCNREIEWENEKIVGREGGLTQRKCERKFLEGIESLREENKGIIPLKFFNQLEHWQSTLYPLFEKT